jgi:outer membrane biosynthesis protein TonB
MTTAGEWLAAHQAADQRRFLNLLVGSVVAHVAIVLFFGVMPAPSRPAQPEVLRVDLVALPAPKARGRPRPPAPPAPKQVVLPKEAPAALPRKREVPRPEPVEYEDALSQLREELGESAPEPVAPLESSSAAADSAPQAAVPGTVVDAEAAAWQRAVSRHLRGCWITPPEFLNRGLVTELQVRLTTTGGLVGAPRVTRASGDPYFDDNTVRAVVSCAPLPPPPEPGISRFAFRSEER